MIKIPVNDYAPEILPQWIIVAFESTKMPRPLRPVVLPEMVAPLWTVMLLLAPVLTPNT